MSDNRRPTDLHLRKQWEVEQAAESGRKLETWPEFIEGVKEGIEDSEAGRVRPLDDFLADKMPEAARLPDEQINHIIIEFGLEASPEEIKRAAEAHLWAYTRVEVAELKQQLFAAEELSEVWHLEAIAVRKAGYRGVAEAALAASKEHHE